MSRNIPNHRQSDKTGPASIAAARYRWEIARLANVHTYHPDPIGETARLFRHDERAEIVAALSDADLADLLDETHEELNERLSDICGVSVPDRGHLDADDLAQLRETLRDAYDGKLWVCPECDRVTTPAYARVIWYPDGSERHVCYPCVVDLELDWALAFERDTDDTEPRVLEIDEDAGDHDGDQELVTDGGLSPVCQLRRVHVFAALTDVDDVDEALLAVGCEYPSDRVALEGVGDIGKRNLPGVTTFSDIEHVHEQLPLLLTEAYKITDTWHTYADMDFEGLRDRRETDDDGGILLPDGGSKYTRPTGPGYLGVHRVGENSFEVHLGSAPIDWEPETRVPALKSDRGVVLLLPERDPPATDDYLDAVKISTKRKATYATATDAVISALGAEPGDDVRVYERPRGPGLLLVPAANDPMLGLGGDR